jgi:LL-diaminopimelate aminotransferase
MDKALTRARTSVRLDRLPPYLFAEMERRMAALVAEGRDVIDLGIGDPDIAPPEPLRARAAELVRGEGVHQYSPSGGLSDYRRAIARWMHRRRGVVLDPNREVALAIGSKEWIAHAPLALTDPGDVVLVPDPGYPPYRSGAIFALCEPFAVPLRPERDFLPDFSEIPSDVARRARLMFMNYPNNPTAAVAPRSFYEELVRFAREFDIVVVSDAAYQETVYEGRAESFLEVEGAREVGVEVHSLSKTFAMTGWRLAWVCGNAEIVSAMVSLKANLDSGQFPALQRAVAETLDGMDGQIERVRETYRRRRDAFVDAMASCGRPVPRPRATFYVWFPTPGGVPSAEFARRALEEAHVVVTPGTGFGPGGEGFVRVALTVPEGRLVEAARRLARLK